MTADVVKGDKAFEKLEYFFVDNPNIIMDSDRRETFLRCLDGWLRKRGIGMVYFCRKKESGNKKCYIFQKERFPYDVVSAFDVLDCAVCVLPQMLIDFIFARFVCDLKIVGSPCKRKIRVIITHNSFLFQKYPPNDEKSFLMGFRRVFV